MKTRGATALGAGLAALAIAMTLPSTAEAQFHFYRDDHVRNRPAHIGVSAIGGPQLHTQERALPVDGFFTIGLDVIGTLVPGFALGFTRAGFAVGYSSTDDAIFLLHATPTFEFSFFPGSDVQLFLQLGATVTFNSASRYVVLAGNAAVTSAIGARFWLGNTFTFGILIGNDIGVTDSGVRRWFGGPLGIGELSFFGGLELGWNL